MQSPMKLVASERDRSARPVASTSMVILTAIDGILRHPVTGSCRDARTALDLLAQQGIPVVLMSHGDPGPVQELQREIGLQEPFVCEGGATLYIPRGYFEELDGMTSGDAAWEVFEFGVRDPARTVRLLTSLYAVRGEDILTIGFGCDWSDRALLAVVEVPIVVRQDAGDHERLLRRFPDAYLTTAIGPAGWSEAVLGAAAV
jgi:predicted mannosyl-3-phosphoglycerate phosphatase (HAD superfamily)